MTMLQWSPVLETGNTCPPDPHPRLGSVAAMEPGLRDREYAAAVDPRDREPLELQWSPVLETGNTTAEPSRLVAAHPAAMEPGLRDREYASGQPAGCQMLTSCNGARS